MTRMDFRFIKLFVNYRMYSNDRKLQVKQIMDDNDRNFEMKDE